jgi:molybdate transport system substrate-binding protein
VREWSRPAPRRPDALGRRPGRRWSAGWSAILAGGLLLVGGRALAQELTLSVAISMKEAVEEVGRGFQASRPGVTLRYNFGASGDLQKQIEAGAPVDVFVSAGQRQMDDLEQRGLIVAESRRAFARNILVVIKPADSRLDLGKPADLLSPRVSRIVIGNPRTVPAGQYAEESLRALGLWDRLRDRLVFAENVRQVLDYVVRGEVDAGVVYTTDAAVRGAQVREAFRPGEETYRPIVYPVAVVTGSRHAALARAFADRLSGPESQAVLRQLGFQPPLPGSR